MWSICTTILLFITSIAGGLYCYLTWNFNYWKKRGISGPTPKLLSGSFPSSINKKRNMIYDIEDIYNKYKKTDRFVGVITIRAPEILVLDPSLAHEIYVTKFKAFENNHASKFTDVKTDEIIGNNPFILQGDAWREKRSEITPALTSHRVKVSYPVMLNSCEKMSNFIRKCISSTTKDTAIDAKKLANRFTAEVVSDCIFGIEAGAFEDEETPIIVAAHKMLDEIGAAFASDFLWSTIPVLGKFMSVPFMSKTSEKFFTDLMNRAIDIRMDNKVERSDFLSYLLRLKEKKNLNNLDMTSHTMTFFIDGYETSASLISHCLLLLARSKPEQDILRREIEVNLQEDGKISFETLSELPYLDQCIHESLRIFSPLLYASKLCTERVELVRSNGEIYVPNVGDTFHLPIHCFHHDAEFYPDPEKFRPERFSVENGGHKFYREQGKYLAFGDGPRTCLGQKFGITQSKAAICEIVKNYEITPSARTRKDNNLDPLNFLAMLEGGIWLNFKEI